MNRDVADLLRQDPQSHAGVGKDRFIAVPGDVTKPETGTEFIQKVVDTFGRLDIFVSNAGVCRFEEFLEYLPCPSLPLSLIPGLVFN